jgi:hypothetical protein
MLGKSSYDVKADADVLKAQRHLATSTDWPLLVSNKVTGVQLPAAPSIDLDPG